MFKGALSLSSEASLYPSLRLALIRDSISLPLLSLALIISLCLCPPTAP